MRTLPIALKPVPVIPSILKPAARRDRRPGADQPTLGHDQLAFSAIRGYGPCGSEYDGPPPVAASFNRAGCSRGGSLPSSPNGSHPIKPSQDEGLARQVHVSIITSDERRNLLPETKETMCSLWPGEGIRRPQDALQTNS